MTALQLSCDDRAALREYLAFYRTHGSQLAALSAFPFVDAECCARLAAGEWESYIHTVREQATKAASAGLSYADWFEIAAGHRRAALAVLYEQAKTAASMASTLARGLDQLIEVAVHTIGEMYVALRLQPASTAGEQAIIPCGDSPTVVA